MDPRYLGLIGKVNWLVETYKQILGRLGYLENNQNNSNFNAVIFYGEGNGSETVFTQTVSAGYTNVIGSLTSGIGDEAAPFSVSISGTTVTVRFYLGTSGTLFPPDGAFTVTLLLIP